MRIRVIILIPPKQGVAPWCERVVAMTQSAINRGEESPLHRLKASLVSFMIRALIRILMCHTPGFTNVTSSMGPPEKREPNTRTRGGLNRPLTGETQRPSKRYTCLRGVRCTMILSQIRPLALLAPRKGGLVHATRGRAQRARAHQLNVHQKTSHRIPNAARRNRVRGYDLTHACGSTQKSRCRSSPHVVFVANLR